MIDLHCHLLPGIDDGAATVADSLQMARMAVADGITDIVVTPHLGNGVYHVTSEKIRRKVASLQQTLLREKIPLQLHPGAEVYLHDRLAENLQNGSVITIGDGGKYLLLELPVLSLPRFTEKLLDNLRQLEIIPIIAHPECQVVLQEQPQILGRWRRDYGCVNQVSAASLAGKMGNRARKTAIRLLQSGLAQVIASDAHNTGCRCPGLSQAYAALAAINPDLAAICQTNAVAILQGRPCQEFVP